MLQIVQTRTAAADALLSKLKARGKLTDESILKVVRRTLSDVQEEGDKRSSDIHANLMPRESRSKN